MYGPPSAVAAVPDFREVLEADLEAEPSNLMQPSTGLAVQPMDAAAARTKLEHTIATFLGEIPATAASVSQTAFSGIMATNLVPAQLLVSLAAQEILARLPDAASSIMRHAAQLLVEAVRKLQNSLGEQAQTQVADQVPKWLEEIQKKRDTVSGLLDKLYETPRIGEVTRALVQKAPDAAGAEAFIQANQALEQLMARYAKTKKILDGLLRVLAFVKVPLMAAVPWGPMGVYATYASVLTYAIFSGADYLDAERLSKWAWLDRVEGLQATVRSAVQAEAD